MKKHDVKSLLIEALEDIASDIESGTSYRVRSLATRLQSELDHEDAVHIALTREDVQDVRDATGCGPNQAVFALKNTNGHVESAISYVRLS